MKSEEHSEQGAAPDGGGGAAHWRRSVVLVLLKIVDAISGFLDRLRSRLDPSSARSDVHKDGKGKSHAQPAELAEPDATTPPKPKRLIYAVAFILTLVIGAAAGGAYAYRMLSKTIAGHHLVVDKLKEDLADVKKQDAANRKELAHRQNTIAAYDKGVVQYLKEIEECKAESEELRGQLSAARTTAGTARKSSPSRDGRSSQPAAVAGQPARPPRSGTCVTDPANIAASLEKCVEEFNRK